VSSKFKRISHQICEKIKEFEEEIVSHQLPLPLRKKKSKGKTSKSPSKEDLLQKKVEQYLRVASNATGNTEIARSCKSLAKDLISWSNLRKECDQANRGRKSQDWEVMRPIDKCMRQNDQNYAAILAITMQSHSRAVSSIQFSGKDRKNLSVRERLMFDLIESKGKDGCTDDEVEISMGLTHQSASSRRRCLVVKGWVKEDPEKKRRETRTGAMAKVWVAK